ncbi:hypothetical protein EYF80_031732 [Liparis tanakae]|uniref:Uncharacterized protein n=1 Tax=Liparis tanakae TaxID=230148 RepID=A0A4Z2GXS6_9TELE|nr:hypothetical protein EYF80_031732 [Liparis tanakae]
MSGHPTDQVIPGTVRTMLLPLLFKCHLVNQPVSLKQKTKRLENSSCERSDRGCVEHTHTDQQRRHGQ